MKIFCTGIAGSNRDGYLKKLVRYTRKKRKNVKFYSVGDIFKENAKKYFRDYDEDNVLNIPFHNRAPIVGESFEQIIADIKTKGYKNIIVSCHAGFYWNKTFERSFIWEKINKLNPDMFITIIDSGKDIKQRLDERSQWSGQKLSLREILLWQNIEVNDAQGIAEIKGKKFYVISSKEPPSLLHKLIFEPNVETVYTSFPMTHLGKDSEKIDSFISRLRNYFVVFNPKSIEIGKRPTEFDEKQTIKRDLEWYIGKVKRVIVFFPRLVASGGVISEMKEAHERGKEVWAIMPKRRYGPFEKDYCKKIFYSQKEFFDFVKHYVKGKKM